MTQETENKLFLLDAYALIFRGYYAFIKNPRINSQGLNTSAIMGFTNSLLDVLKREKPTHIAVVFDVGRQTLRHDYFPEYKANRDETPEAIRVAVPYIHKILEALKIPILFAEGYEADDVIGTLSKKAEKAGFTTYMMTPDKDFGQLVSQKIFMYKPASRGGGNEIWGIPEIQAKFGVERPEQVIDFLGMMGDSVDNIPGLPGVGEKTAKKFLAQYGTIENLLANTHELKGKLKEKIEENKELGLLSKKLATILTDAPVDFMPEKLIMEEPDWEAVKSVFSELEFRRMLDNLLKTYDKTPPNETPKSTPKSRQMAQQTSLFEQGDWEKSADEPTQNEESGEYPHFYQSVTTPKGRGLLLQKIMQQKEVCFDCETTSLKALEAELVGIAFSWEKGKGYYLSFDLDFAKTQEILSEFQVFFTSDKILKIGHNLKYDTKVLYKYGIRTSQPIYDTMIAHYLVNPDMRHNMDVLSETYLDYKPTSIVSLLGKKGKNQKKFNELELEVQTEYAVEDADITLQLKQVFEEKLSEPSHQKLLREMELPLVEVLAEMEETGIHLDVNALEQQSKTLETDLAQLEKNIYAAANEEFNLNSPKQLGEVLFDKLKLLAKPKKTKTGQYATSEDILAKLASEHEIVRDILEYRQLQKLKSTYVDALPNEVSPKTMRVHTSYLQTVAATGRLASNNPNLQNIPIRTERGRKVRSAFVAKDENHVLLAADYSQIELRLIAHMSEDPELLRSFQNEEDIHAATAAKVFGVTLEEVSREQRSQAKTVNFGIIYGVSAFGLSEQTGLSRSEAKDLIDAYYATYPTLKAYMSQQIESARTKGFVETLFGRRRYLRDIHSNNHVVRSHAERNAVNAPIQGSAADIIKIAMLRMHSLLKKEMYGTKMLLQVHDELVFEVPKTELEEMQALVKHTMENSASLQVPLTVEVGVGQNWLEAH